MKINKNHGGKEFQGYFRFIGQVKRRRKGVGEDVKLLPIYEMTKTTTDKNRRVLQFEVMTSIGNRVKTELAGMEQKVASLYSSSDKQSVKINWDDRFNKSKYPNATYHLIDQPWDLAEEIGNRIKENDWVEVKGNYEFDTFTKDDGEQIPVIKRIIKSVEPIQDGQEITYRKEKFNYVCDFNSPDFREVNYFKLEIGINSTYQDEATKDTLVNGIFLTYGKERSIPQDVKLIVYHKESAKKSLADAFAQLNRGDFIKVEGIDNNRVEYTWVDKEVVEIENDPFADVEEKETEKERVVNGTKKGLEITNILGNLMPQLLTEEEMEKGIEALVVDNAEEVLPF